MKLLRFTRGNAKLDEKTYIFNLPAGHTCCGAKLCWSYANRRTGKITDGPDTQFRCYAATIENRFHKARALTWRNFSLLNKLSSVEELKQLILNSIPAGATKIRVHSHGDFFSVKYFQAWMLVAKERPEILFYSYTKSLPIWVRYKHMVPKNYVLTASYGGKWDQLIRKHRLKSAEVVFDTETKLPLDHDDSHACDPKNKRFALLIHGIQPANSEASMALSQLRKQGIRGYSKA